MHIGNNKYLLAHGQHFFFINIITIIHAYTFFILGPNRNGWWTQILFSQSKSHTRRLPMYIIL